MSDSDRERRARLYTEERQRTIEKALGSGTDGSVWQTSRSTAVKACDDFRRYSTERDCYRLFYERGVDELCGYTIPTLIDYSDQHMVIEMSVVKPPYIIDFGKACLNSAAPTFSQQTMADWYAEKKELWGDYWPEILSILRRLRSLGVIHMDPRPGNIMPANWDPPL